MDLWTYLLIFAFAMGLAVWDKVVMVRIKRYVDQGSVKERPEGNAIGVAMGVPTVTQPQRLLPGRPPTGPKPPVMEACPYCHDAEHPKDSRVLRRHSKWAYQINMAGRLTPRDIVEAEKRRQAGVVPKPPPGPGGGSKRPEALTALCDGCGERHRIGSMVLIDHERRAWADSTAAETKRLAEEVNRLQNRLDAWEKSAAPRPTAVDPTTDKHEAFPDLDPEPFD